MDSLYFNAHVPLAVETSKNWPKVVTDALYDKNKNESAEDEPDGSDGTRRDTFSANWSSPARLNDSVSSKTPVSSIAPVVNMPDDLVPPPIPPKSKMSKSKSMTGAKPKRITDSSIVSKYLGDRSAPQRKLSSTSVTGPLTTMEPLIDFGTNHEPQSLSFTTSEHEDNLPEPNYVPNSGRKNSKSNKSQRDKSTMDQRNGAIPKHVLPTPQRPPRSTTSMAFPSSQSQPSLPHYSVDSPTGSQPTRMRTSRSTLSKHDSLGGFSTTQSTNSLSLPEDREGNSKADSNEREKLREMLASLRKDPFDEDLENNDGSFFPCEFCGDPYPSEFIMRHQVSGSLKTKWLKSLFSRSF